MKYTFIKGNAERIDKWACEIEHHRKDTAAFIGFGKTKELARELATRQKEFCLCKNIK